jgi:hypothetical protein
VSRCPRCGSTAEVHAIGELADLARMQLSKLHGQLGQNPGGPQQGWAAEPVAGPPPGPDGRRPLFGGMTGRGGGFDTNDAFDSIGDAVAGVAMGAAAQFIGRAVRKRVENTLNQRVMPAVTQQAETVLQNQIAVAERYPDLRACMTDHVVFLAGGSLTQPMPDLSKITVAQADALVAQLQG